MRELAGRAGGLALLALVVGVAAATRNVACCSFNSLVGNLSSAVDNDVFVLAPGTYTYDSYDFTYALPVGTTKNFTVVGAGAGAVVNFNGEAVNFLCQSTASAVTIINVSFTQSCGVVFTQFDARTMLTVQNAEFSLLSFGMTALSGSNRFDGCTFRDYFLSSGLFSFSGPAVISNCTFTNVAVDTSLTLISSTSDLTISRSRFTLCLGGSIIYTSGVLLLSDSTFNMNSATAGSAGNLAVGVARTVYNRTNMYNNYGQGGGITNCLTVDGSNFINGTGDYYSYTFFYVSAASDVLIRNTVFAGAKDYQALLSATASNARTHIIGSQFISNSGAGLVYAGQNTTITGSTFRGNSITTASQLLYTGTLVMRNSVFAANSADLSSHLIYAGVNSPATIDTVDFSDNANFNCAVYLGGTGQTATLTSTRFFRNNAGAFACAAGDLALLKLFNASVFSNTGLTSTLIQAGAGAVILQQSEVYDNVSPGSFYGVLSTNGPTTITDTVMRGNTLDILVMVYSFTGVGATTITGLWLYSNTGQCVIDSNLNMTVVGSTFQGNSITGSILHPRGNVTVLSSLFWGNNLGVFTGTYLINSAQAVRVHVNSVTFKDNVACGGNLLDVSGTALRWVSLSNVTATGNSAALSAIGSMTLTTIVIDRSYFGGNAVFNELVSLRGIVSISNTVFDQNALSQMNLISTAGPMNVINATITQQYDAGYLVTASQALQVVGSFFSANTVDCLVRANSDLLISNSTFAGNEQSMFASAGAFIDMATPATLNIQTSRFISNVATDTRYLIQATPRGATTLTDCLFDQNVVYGLYSISGSATSALLISRVIFTRNFALLLNLVSTSINSTVIQHTVIDDNVGQLQSLMVLRSPTLLSNVRFSNNDLCLNIGIRVAASVNMTGVSFVGNTNINPLISAQVVSDQRVMYINNCTFDGNQDLAESTSNGALLITEQDLFISGSSFTRNSAGFATGMIMNRAYGRFTLQSSTFVQNDLEYHSIVFMLVTGEAVVTNCTFFGNRHALAALWLRESQGSVLVSNTTFVSNMISVLEIEGDSANTTVINSVFANNTVTDAEMIRMYAGGQLINCYMVNNVLSMNSMIIASKPLNVTNCQIVGNRGFYYGITAYGVNSTLTVIGSNLSNNTGCNLIITGVDIYLMNNTVSYNQASSVMIGSYNIPAVRVYFATTSFVRNKGSNDALIYFISTGETSYINCSFVGNVNVEPVIALGGAPSLINLKGLTFFINQGSLIQTASTFSGNQTIISGCNATANRVLTGSLVNLRSGAVVENSVFMSNDLNFLHLLDFTRAAHPVSISGVYILDNSDTGYLMRMERSNVSFTVTNTIIRGNTGCDYGLHFITTGGNLLFTGMTVSGNLLYGFLYTDRDVVVGGSALTVADSTFTSNVIWQHAILQLSSSTNIIRNVTFRSNTAFNGHIWAPIGQLSISGSTFDSSVITVQEPVHGRAVTIDGSTFSNLINVGGEYASYDLSLPAVSSLSLVVGGSTFINLQCRAVAASTNLSVTSSRFDTIATENNGAAFTANNATVLNSTFVACSGNDGGAVYAGAVNISGSNFTRCAGMAGVVYADYATIRDTTFTGNSGSSTLGTGGLYTTRNTTLEYVTFNSNVGYFKAGGVTAATASSFVARHVTCISNAGNEGGCMSITATPGAYITVSHLKSTSDYGYYGGGVVLNAAAGSFNNITITNGRANNAGGGFYIFSTTSSTTGVTMNGLNITGCVVDNTMTLAFPSGGGAVYASLPQSSLTIHSAMMANNVAGINGGGIVLNRVSSARLINTTIRNNLAQSGAGFAVFASNVSVENTTITANTAANFGGGLYATSSAYNLTGATRITCNSAGMGGIAISCTNSRARVESTVQITSAPEGGSSSDTYGTWLTSLAGVTCSSCAGDCRTCLACIGGCRQSGPNAGCYHSQSPCTTCQAGFTGANCDVSDGLSCQGNLGCPTRAIGSTCQIRCNNSYTNPAINLNALGNVTCLNPAAGWPYANACIPCPPHKSGLNCSVVEKPACPALNGSGLASSCPIGYNGDTCTPACNTSAFYIRNPLVALPVTCSKALGRWDNAAPPCVINATIQCPPVASVPSHATIGSCGAAYVGSNCTLGCQDGYAPSGVALGNCMIQGTSVLWVGHTITCNPVNCNGGLSLPANANAGTCTVGLLGGTCQLGCNVNFAATNPIAGTCTAGVGPTAKWVGQNTTCVSSVCGTPPPTAYPTGGNAGNCSVGGLGDICYLACNNGYTASASVKGTCTTGSSSAAWTGMSIQCTAATCPAITPPVHSVSGTCTSGGTLGASCTLACTTGYYAVSMVAGTCSPTGPGSAAWTGAAINCTAASCGAYAALPQSATVGTCSGGAQGSTCQLSCASGYVISNQVTGTCVGVGSTAQWTGLNITCSWATCPAATGLPPNAMIGTCGETTKLYGTCLLTCSSGYIPSAVVQGVCSPAGVGLATWQGQNITCTAASCAALTPASPRAVGTCGAGALDSTCALSCASGYVLTTTQTGTCRGCGVGCAQWLGAGGVCQQVNCTAPSLLALPIAAMGTCGNGPQGATCQLGCANGYIASGVGTATCSACGYNCAQWSPLTITCTAALCPAPAVPANASLGTCTNNAAQGAACNFTCLDGFVPSGVAQGACQANAGPSASWTGQSITCSPASCATLSGLTGGRTAGTCGVSGVGSSCTMGCANGYSQSAVRPGICVPGLGASASWVNMSIVCTAVSCAPLTPTGLPSFSTLGTCNATQILGSSCALDCQYGYVRANNASFTVGTCVGTGPGAAAWQGQDIVCIPPGACTTVSAAVYGPNGTPGNCTNQANGTMCKLGCANGYVIASFSYGLCSDFNWNGPAISCVAATCAPALPPVNGVIGDCGVASQGAVCSLACSNGYIPSGAVQGTCTLDAGNTASWKNQALVCSAAQCPALTGLGAGVLVGTCTLRSLGASCALTCASGYNASSSQGGTCAPATGPVAVWTGQAISCTPAFCDAITPPLNAQVGTCGSAVLGSACNLTCQNGYSASGSQPGSCVAGAGGTATWVGMVIACNPVSCSSYASLPALATVGTCTTAPLSSTCSLECMNGYQASATTGTCVAGTGASAVWSGLSVTCTPAQCAPVTSYPSQATVGTCTTATLGSTCTLGCNDGYSPTGVMSGTCSPMGPAVAAWAGLAISCIAAQCPAVTTSTGVLVGSCGVASLGQTCQLVCANGYATSDLNPGTCTGVGSAAVWQTPTITCSPASCAPAVVPSHAVLNSCGVKSLLSTCSLDCADGYQATTISQGTCEPTLGANARWVNASITCLVLGTVCYNYDGALPSNANIGTCFSAAVGSTCSLGCDNGYVPSTTSGSCSLDSGQLVPTWHDLSISCVPASCAPVTSFPSHATAGTCTTAALESSCTLGCEDGYVPSNVGSGTCVPGFGPVAAWQGQSITCLPASCPDVPASLIPAHANMGSCSAAMLGADCFLECEPGTTASGDGSMRCAPASGPNAAWIPQSALTCQPPQCPALAALPAHGTVGNCTAADLGSVCLIACEDGYALSDVTPGLCDTSGGSPAWHGESGTCSPVNCEALTAADLGSNTLPGTCGTSQALDATCNLACADGYAAQGSSPGTCTAGDGPTATWVGQSITCAAITGNAAINGAVSPPPGTSSTLILAIVIPAALVLLLCLLLIIVLARRKKGDKKGKGKAWTDDNATRVFVDANSTVLIDDNATHMLGDSQSSSSLMYSTHMSNPIEMNSMRTSLILPDDTIQGPGGSTRNLTGTTAGRSSEKMELSITVDDVAMAKAWSDFTVVRDLGAGSAGPVILVRENSTYTEMAYKVYRAANDPSKVAVLEAATKTAMTLHNNFVTACFGFMKHDNDVGILTEFMPGGNIKTAVLKPAKLKAALVDACKGLAYIHTRNLVHGNVRPANILLNAQGNVKLADFGMNAGDSTPEAYAAPEVLQGGAPTAASDVYAFGLTIGEVFIGRTPFAHVAGLRLQNLAAKPWDNLDYHSVPANVRHIIEGCTEADPVRRPTTTDVIEAFNQLKE